MTLLGEFAGRGEPVLKGGFAREAVPVCGSTIA
jgi:hypothetical protein